MKLLYVKAFIHCAIFSALLLQGCAKKAEKTQQFQVDSEFTGFVKNFESVSSTQGQDRAINDLVVEFGDTPTLNETGVCEITEGETPKITINEKIWENLNAMDRQEVIFHEMGHCVLRRKHQEGTITVGGYWGTVPDSIMYPYRIPGSIYEPNADYYNKELFSVAKQNQF